VVFEVQLYPLLRSEPMFPAWEIFGSRSVLAVNATTLIIGGRNRYPKGQNSRAMYLSETVKKKTGKGRFFYVEMESDCLPFSTPGLGFVKKGFKVICWRVAGFKAILESIGLTLDELLAAVGDVGDDDRKVWRLQHLIERVDTIKAKAAAA